MISWQLVFRRKIFLFVVFKVLKGVNDGSSSNAVLSAELLKQKDRPQLVAPIVESSAFWLQSFPAPLVTTCVGGCIIKECGHMPPPYRAVEAGGIAGLTRNT